MNYWVAVVDGNCYGFFQSETAALGFVYSDFPVAFDQNNFDVYEFVHIAGTI